HIAINLAPSDVDSPLTQVWLTKMVERAKICCDNVMVEITERGVVDHDAKDKLVSIRARGFRLAIDDFGTGQSSLSQIATYNFDFLKIDKSFVDVVCTDTLSSKVAFNVIHLAKSLGMQMIAEGVETQEQATVLEQAGVQYAQGWLFARAMPFDDMLRFAQRHPAAA
ncbi:MAG: EAL domain-containing protein, partial [Burkholderiaceae bacterium]|nr:EAL domain-containing protein [Burkholderiaceae bacterium]